MTAAIFGSCVSRDLFEDGVLRPTVGSYAARSSIISAVAPPLAIDESRVVLSSAWQCRCVLADFHKTFLTSLHETPPDWLVIDLIDERFDLLRTKETCVTRSSAFEAAGLGEAADFEFELVRRMSNDARSLFDDAAAQFASRVTEVMPAHRVVVHRALWCTRYRSDGEILTFTGDRLALCERQNEMLNHGYDALASAFGGRAESIEADPDQHLADAGHHWGLEPYHYEQAYNAYAIQKLRDAFGLG
jgi:hypothetical protein